MANGNLAAGSSAIFDDWAIPRGFRGRFRRRFNMYRRYNDQPLDKIRFSELYNEFLGMEFRTMAIIFDLADVDRTGYLEEDTFILACHLSHIFNADTIPDLLADDLVPPSKRKVCLPKLPPEPSDFTPCPASFKPYGYLSDELWSIIMSCLSKSTLNRATQASKRFNAIGNLLLFRNFDVKLQSESKRFNNDPYDRTCNRRLPWTPPKNFSSMVHQNDNPWDPNQEVHCRIQQYRFLRHMMQNPEHGQYIQTFIFTMGLDFDEDMLPEFPYWIDGLRYKYIDPTNLYRMFDLFKNVTYLDLDMHSLNPSWVPGLESIFPRAEVIQLRGRMDPSFVKSILHGDDKAKLKRLVLGNIFDCRLATPEEIEQGKQHESFTQNEPKYGYVNMLGHLNADLHDRCSHVESLYLSKFAQFHGRQSQKDHCLFYTKHEGNVYQEWAAFVAFTKPKRLILRQQIPGEWSIKATGAANRSPANLFFRTLLLPTLLKGWDGLEYLEISGISRNNGELLETGLRGVEVVIDHVLEAFTLLEEA